MRKLGAVACGVLVMLLVPGVSTTAEPVDRCEKDLDKLTRTLQQRAVPSITDAPPPQQFVASLDVLQRAQDPLTDLPGGTDLVLRRALKGQARTVAVGGARLLGTMANGTTLYVVPAASFSFRAPRSCKAEAGRPIRQLERLTRRAAHELGLAVIQVTAGGEAIGWLAAGADALANGSVGFEHKTRRDLTYGGVVPDGVSSVRLMIGPGLPWIEPDVEVTIPVSGNIWSRTVSKRQAESGDEPLYDDVVWLDGNGQPIGPATSLPR